MTLAGPPARSPRHALLVGSNPAVTRVFRTYLHREGVRCHEATPAAVVRAALDGSPLAGLDGPSRVAVTLVVASGGLDLGRVQSALDAIGSTAGVPVLVVESVAGDSFRSPGPGAELPTLTWPFRLRDVLEAITAAVAVTEVAPVPLRPPVRRSHGRVAPKVDPAPAPVAVGALRP